MTKKLLDQPAVIDRLRRFRPLYERLRGATREPALADRPDAILAELGRNAIFLLSLGRSGSTVFGDYLASHPDIVKMGEVLNEGTFRSFFRSGRWRLGGKRPSQLRQNFYLFLRDRARAYPGKRLLFDMKFEFLHLVDGNFRIPGYGHDFLELLANSNCPVILLERRDHVARYVSLRVAMAKGRFHSYEQARGGSSIRIDLAHLARVVGETERQIAYARDRFRDHPRFLDLAYEELFVPATDGGSRFDPALGPRLAALLGLEDRFDPSPRLESLSDRDALDPVENRAEVEAWQARRRSERQPA